MDTELDKLYEDYQNDGSLAIKNLRSKANKFVSGIGPVNPDIMLIGEAPGRDEDKVGEPFVGRAGEVLDTLFLRAKVKRSETFVTNVVKYRPVNELDQNRTPTEQEINASRKYIIREIELVNPKIIGLMGGPAIKTFFPLHSPKEYHGKFYQHSETSWKVIFLFHPAVAAYNPKMLPVLIDDFKQLVVQLKKL